MILEFPPRQNRRVSEVDAASEVPRLAPGAALLIMLLLSLALWGVIWCVVALWGAVNG